MRPSNNLENKTPPDTYWVQLVCKKAQAHSSLEPPLELPLEYSSIGQMSHNTGPDIFKESRFVMTFLTILGVILYIFFFTSFVACYNLAVLFPNTFILFKVHMQNFMLCLNSRGGVTKVSPTFTLPEPLIYIIFPNSSHKMQTFFPSQSTPWY